eukprot:Gb_22114 [translate_table: standard]
MTTRKLIVEVVDAHSLMPKDGVGTSSPYVLVDFDGQRKRTKTKHKDLNPVWNEKLEFTVSDPKTMAAEELEADVYNDKRTGNGRRSHFLGRVRIGGSQFVKKGEEALIYFPLGKRNLFSLIKGELGLRIYYVDEPIPPPEEEQPAEPSTEAAQPVEAAPASEEAAAPPADAPAAEAAPPAEAPPTEEPPADAPPAEAAPAAEEPPADAPPTTEAAPADAAPPAEAPLAETPPAEATAAEAAPSDAPPVEEKPSEETPPAGETTQPDEQKPADEAPPAEAKPPDQEKPADEPILVQNPPMASVSGMPADYVMKDLSGSFESNNERSAYDLVQKMQYLFVRIVKARALPPRDSTTGSPADPFVKIRVGGESVRTRTSPKTGYPEWDKVFAFGQDKLQSAPTLEISVWDGDTGSRDDFLGGVCFDLSEVPTRVPPDSPLAPQWYRLEGEGRVKGDIMLAVWIGTQADEAFPVAWQSDAGSVIHTRSKVYLSPKLWYLRVNIIEAQDLQIPENVRYPELRARVQLGFQVLRTRPANNRNSSPFWNEDLLFVAAEPFEEQLFFIIEERSTKEAGLVGHARVALSSIERRVDDRMVSSRWFNLDRTHGDPNDRYHGRIHLRVCLDGGYHVMDEAAHLSSDLRPTAKQLWKPSLGVLELGILGAQNLLPMKTKNGRGATDAYCVAKYGQKWVRTRTITDSYNPRWNEQYTWEVYDPCTVLTLGVFDNWHIFNTVDEKAAKPDYRIGKVRIRISTLESNKVYTNSYPLLVLMPSGVKKMGEIELAVRFTCPSLLDVLHVYTQPMLPKMHYLHPLGLHQQDLLRNTAMEIVARRLSRSEPPLRKEVVQYMLDTDSNMWSMRRSKANWFRIMNVLSGVVNVTKWVDDICLWKNPVTTVLVHILFLILVWYPELIVPTVFFYVFLIGSWYYRFRPRMPPHMDTGISHADAVDPDELDEEFDPIPSQKPPEVVRFRYDRLRSLAGRIQSVLGDFATQGERIQALLSWRDPRATGIFIAVCFMISLILYIVHFKMVSVVLGFYFLRHPRFRGPMPASSLNFFRRLPALSDRLL